MKVLSLFDGMACGYEALQRAGIPIDVYYASEIDKHAIKVALKNHPDIIEIGDVCQVKGEDYPNVDLVIGGSPCQGFSMAGKMLNFEDPRSKLFFEFVRLVKEVKPKYFLLENVKMKKEFIEVINEQLRGITPTLIDSALVSAQRRKRNYRVGKLQEDGTYTKVEIPQPEDKGILLKDILLDYVEPKYDVSEKHTIAMQNARSCGELNLPSPDEKCGTIIAGYYKTPQDGPYILKDYELTESQQKNYERSFGSKGKILDDVEGKCPTLTASMGTGGGNVPCIIQKVGDRDKNNWGVRTDKSYTLPANPMSGRGQLVVEPMIAYAQGSREFEQQGFKTGKAPTLCARDYKDPKIVAIPCATQIGQSKNCGNSYGSNKAYTLRASNPNGVIESVQPPRIRKLTPIECERLQTMPDNYTEGVSDTQRYKMLGNGWTCDVIAHIFSFIDRK